MFRNYMKIALRNLLKYKGYSFINVLGLAIGMTCCILILLFVQDELSYDQYHANADRIVRVTREWLNADGETSLHLGHVAPPIAPLLESDYPEILQAVRLRSIGEVLVQVGDKYFEEERFFFADPDIFQVFTLPLLKGDPNTALNLPNAVILNEAMAEKYFGEQDPIGEVLRIDDEIDLKVTGVMRNTPRNSHFHLNFLGSMEGLKAAFGEQEFQSWGSNNYATYLLLPEAYPPEDLQAKLPDFIDKHYGAAILRYTGEPPSRQPSERNILHLQPLTDIHLHSHLDSEIEANGNIVYVYVFASVAFFVLLIACVNFMNLATARSARRAKEVGLRKVVGADRKRLILQFLGESILLSLVSLALAIGAVELLLPWFGDFVGRELDLAYSENLLMLFSLAAIALFVGVVAGSYPAFYLSAFQPAHVLKGQQSSSHKSNFRTALVVCQFAISIILIVSVGVVDKQLEYCNTKNLGLNREHVVVLPASERMIERYEGFKSRLLSHPSVVSVAASKRVPSGRLLDSSGARVIKGDQEEPLNFRIANVRVDHNFLDAYGIELAAGRNFDPTFSTDSTDAFILNETAVDKIGWTSPAEAVGKPFGYGGRRGQIIGVVKDFHYESLHQPITPIVMLIMPNSFNQVSVRMRAEHPGEIDETMVFLKDVWQEYRPNYPFSYEFLDQRYENLYRSEHRLGQIFLIFSSLAIFIACLGLFGLASFSAEQRTKEIGVRKVLGASVSSVILLLSKEFTKLVLVATLVAWPVAYIAMNGWLKDFAYSIKLNSQVDIFVLSALLALIIAVATVSFQSVRAALTNPVEALRYE